ncbi:MAG TPA: hypothetical protein PKN29_11035 [Candidatus Ozemobacteraceae bacterium]|nr:hypothetical protein [Candidatus Ozemobacteraceae bacterium]
MSDRIPSPFATGFFTSWGMLYRAILIVAVFGIMHFFGWREHTSFITGTISGGYQDILGMAYFIFYAMTIFVAPVLIPAAWIMFILERWPGDAGKKDRQN